MGGESIKFISNKIPQVFGKDSGSRVLTKGTLEGEYHKYEPKPTSRFRPRKLEPVVEGRTGRDNY
ncbi:hypothetical protein FD723_03210 [Nostoc sp. C052]|nr:hypothetical protein FD723_03210 [Nostoc sp. C052]